MALRAVLERQAIVRRVEMTAKVNCVIVRYAARAVPVIQMATRAGRLSGCSAREAAAVALRAVQIRLAVARRVEIAAEADRVSGHSAVRRVPMIHMAFGAGRLSDGTSLEAVAVARGAMREGLAVTARMIRSAQIHVVSGSDRHARPCIACAHRIIRVPATQRREGEEDGYDNGAKCFLAHNCLRHAQHASLIQGLRIQVKAVRRLWPIIPRLRQALMQYVDLW